MVLEEEGQVSLERRRKVRETLEFLKYDGQLVLEPQWYSKTSNDKSKRFKDKL
ncbi:MAG: hypothetical protein ACFFB5_14430 [Promethearchaeota archaeon]